MYRLNARDTPIGVRRPSASNQPRMSSTRIGSPLARLFVGARDAAWGGACSSCEAGRCLYEELVGEVCSAVVFVFDDVQGGSR